MIYVHDFDPVILSLGPLHFRWYGLMYVIGFSFGYIYLLRSRFVKEKGFSREEIENILFYAIIGIILGARLGFFLLYQFEMLYTNPLEIFYVWHGGMSAHGGILGLIIAFFIFGIRHKKHFLDLTDIAVIPAALGFAFGRIGNFINGELWGRVTDQTWGVLFPRADEKFRHPSQLYSSLQHFLTFIILYTVSYITRKRGLLSCLFVILYGLGRMFIEEPWREPADGYILGITTGQFYSIPLVIVGVSVLIVVCRKQEKS